jgi:transcription antitermination factor NusG
LNACAVPWFAVRVKSQCEQSVAHAFRQRDYEEFLPLYWSRRRWSDRIKMLQLPLFAGYLFCRFDPSQRARILEVPGVVHIAGIGKIPLAVDSAEVEAIRLAVNSGQRLEPWNHMQVGDTVRVEEGPLCGLQGVLLRLKGGSHLILSIKMLQRGVAVEVERSLVVPCAPRGESSEHFPHSPMQRATCAVR